MNNSNGQPNKTPNGHFKLSTLPREINQAIEKFYEQPIKLDIKEQPHDIRLTSLTKSEATILAQLVCAFTPERSLEIGMAAAGSCVAIATARKSLGLSAKHVALDPYQETDAGSLGLCEIQRSGLDDFVSWIAERSENYLNAAAARGEKFDLIFIDGGHDIGQTVTDAFSAHETLNEQGVVAFHDSCLFSTAAAVRYLMLERGYSLIPLPSDSNIKTLGRGVRHLNQLGLWYVTRVVPRIHGSLVALRKNS